MAGVQEDFAAGLEIPNLEAHARQFEIAPATQPRRMAMLESVGDAPTASLVKGQVTAFTANMSGQDKQDIEYTTLAAQLNSDVKVPDNQSMDGMKAWFKNYSNVMSNLGWVMSFNWEKFDAHSADLTVDKVIIQVLEAVASQNGAAIAKAAIDAISALPADGNRLRLFNNSTVSDKAGKFLLGLADKQGDAISLSFGAFAMDYATRDTGVLWFHWKSSDLSIFKNQMEATFNQHAYAGGARDRLEAKLQGHVATFVDDLDLGL